MTTPLETHLEVNTVTPPPEHRPDWTSISQAVTGIVTCLALGCGLVWWLAASYEQLGQLRADIRNYTAEINKRLDDHESRLRAIEMRRP
jgi:hypothetical protein